MIVNSTYLARVVVLYFAGITSRHLCNLFIRVVGTKCLGKYWYNAIRIR